MENLTLLFITEPGVKRSLVVADSRAREYQVRSISKFSNLNDCLQPNNSSMLRVRFGKADTPRLPMAHCTDGRLTPTRTILKPLSYLSK
ncbi:hypothetical protein [Chamaesiphon sp. VAR_48_metabat_403]|uniref:hypothetical protein n=1 Tax=Chamaesiphon sp. VAR_48_metabat_403 TaxID=2964700 RepID=UPI00286E0E2A|nr:hypothetical protein [Chamaesiphon sp. VAR_48_metabat_403]